MPLIQAAISDQAKRWQKEPCSDKPGHGSWDQGSFGFKRSAAKTVGQVGLLATSLNGGPVAGLKGTVPLSTVGSVTANVSSNATTVVNNLLGRDLPSRLEQYPSSIAPERRAEFRRNNNDHSSRC
jgi:hypothetical protein